MGIFDIFKTKEKKQDLQYAKMLNGTIPIFSQFGDNIYASDVVQQAIYTIVTEMQKLNPKHVKRAGMDVLPVSGEIQRVLDNPNDLMTKSDLIEKITWQVMLNQNAFIYIEKSGDRPTGLYPINPVQVTFLQTNFNEMFVKMRFKNGQEFTLPYKSLIHIKTHFFMNDFMGGNESGQPDNEALLKTLSLNDMLLQGVKKAMQSSFAVNGVVKYGSMLSEEKLNANLAEFENSLRNSQSGILAIDNKAEYTQLRRDISLVDETTLKFIDEKILRQFGVPACIVLGDYTTAQYNAFYQKTLEPLVIKYSEAFSKGLFTNRQLESFENKIYFYPKELVMMSIDQTLQMINSLSPTGTLFENEKRFAFGLEPHPDLVGKRLQSLNYVDVGIAQQYQLKGTLSQSTEEGEGEE